MNLQGQFLVASPQLLDPNFFRSVVLLVQHDENGAMGVVLTRPLDISIEDTWEKVDDESPCNATGPLFLGGPCEGPLMVLHNVARHAQIRITPALHFSTEKDSIRQIVARKTGPRRFFVGYSGWTAGQLEAEVEEGSWLTTVADPQQVFFDVENLWASLKKKIDRDRLYATLPASVIPQDPSLN